MGAVKKCKDVKKKNLDPKNQEKHKFKCKKCKLTAKKANKLCKPVENKGQESV